MMRAKEVGLGTRVRVHLHRGKEGPAQVRARGVVAEVLGYCPSCGDLPSPAHNTGERRDLAICPPTTKIYRVEILNGNECDFERDTNGELWLFATELTPYVPRTKTNPKTVARRREFRARWKEGRNEALAKGRRPLDGRLT